MTEREKVTKGLKCCRDIHLDATLEESCNTCPFQKEKGRTWALLDGAPDR